MDCLSALKPYVFVILCSRVHQWHASDSTWIKSLCYMQGSFSPGMSDLDAAVVEQMRQDSDFISGAIESLSKTYPEVCS
jgi:hypothetical protein